jgi:cytochrome c oxidase cbb3-type subunit 1
VTLYFLALTVGGWFQGLAMNNPEIPWIRIVADTIPYLQLRTIGGISMTVGHILFAMLFVQNLLKLSPRRTGPAYFTEREPQSGSELKTEN